jgi:hypothetical protein
MLQALAGNKVGGPADRLGFAGKKVRKFHCLAVKLKNIRA